MTIPYIPSPPAGTHGGCTHTSAMDGDGTIHLYCTPTAPEPAAAPLVDTAAVREIAALFDPPHPADAGLLYAAADELDTHRARHAELVALVAKWRDTATNSDGVRVKQSACMVLMAYELARVIGEQP